MEHGFMQLPGDMYLPACTSVIHANFLTGLRTALILPWTQSSNKEGSPQPKVQHIDLIPANSLALAEHFDQLRCVFVLCFLYFLFYM